MCSRCAHPPSSFSRAPMCSPSLFALIPTFPLTPCSPTCHPHMQTLHSCHAHPPLPCAHTCSPPSLISLLRCPPALFTLVPTLPYHTSLLVTLTCKHKWEHTRVPFRICTQVLPHLSYPGPCTTTNRTACCTTFMLGTSSTSTSRVPMVLLYKSCELT